VSEGYRFSSISANWGYTLAVDKNGNLRIWGEPFNWSGGVGTLPSEPGPYVAVAAGWDHALALHQDGRVVAWGANDWGQRDPIPNYSFKAIAADEHYSMGIIKSEDPVLDDALIVWGGNMNYNRVDFPAEVHASTFDPQNNPQNIVKVHAIAAGGHHALAILKSDDPALDRTLRAWGPVRDVVNGRYNYNQGTVPNGSEPQCCTSPAPGNVECCSTSWAHDLRQVKFWAVAAGHFHSVALAMDGRVYAWGRNGDGQAESPPASERFASVSAGYMFSAALRPDGTAVAWGSNNGLGNSSYSGQLDVPDPAPEFTQIAAGYYHMSALEGCYANCDNSLDSPFLSANDFMCFNYRLVMGDPWANCDGSTVEPILNIDDFTCFTNRYATCGN
jgi:hypothetical protein